MWVRYRERSEAPDGRLDSRLVERLGGLFSVRDYMDKVHKVAMVALLKVCGFSKPSGEEEMIWMEWREDDKNVCIVGIKEVEGMAHLIPLELGKVWLVNNRIDLLGHTFSARFLCYFPGLYR